MKTKPCSRCQISKPLGSFHRNHKALDGRHTICQACRCAYNNAKLAVKRNRAEYRTREMKLEAEMAAKYVITRSMGWPVAKAARARHWNVIRIARELG